MPTCFVIMPIGEQSFPGGTVSADELQSRYDDLIKEAILRALPSLEVTRADDVALPGTITSDIITRLMHSDFVVADVTYSNPNVFYELGLRHACRNGTVIIRDRSGPRVPFDIAHLRHVEYENSPSGLKALADDLKGLFPLLVADPRRPDNHFQEYAKLTGYRFPDYAVRTDQLDAKTAATMAVLKSPEVMDLLIRHSQGEPVDEIAVLRAMMANPEASELVVRAMVTAGEISGPSQPRQSLMPRKNRRRATKKRRK